MPAPVYVISGWMRSGTSMMMRALEAGGMDAAYRTSRDRLRARYADRWYDPNTGGLYELARADYLAPGFPAGYEGRLVKSLRRAAARWPVMPGGLRMVYMLRDPEEIRQSFLGFFGGMPPPAEAIAAETTANLRLLRARADLALMTMPYRRVVEQPRDALAAVAGHFGVRLDVAAAAGVVDPDLYRYRRHELEPGIV